MSAHPLLEDGCMIMNIGGPRNCRDWIYTRCGRRGHRTSRVGRNETSQRKRAQHAGMIHSTHREIDIRNSSAYFIRKKASGDSHVVQAGFSTSAMCPGGMGPDVEKVKSLRHNQIHVMKPLIDENILQQDFPDQHQRVPRRKKHWIQCGHLHQAWQ